MLHKILSYITDIWSLSHLLGVKIVYLVDKRDLIKISNLVDDVREIVTSLSRSSLKGQRQFMAGIVS